MRLDLLGVRGSTPAPGAAFVRYGGNTACVAVTAANHTVPTLALDAGTGLRNLTSLLGGGAFNGAILVSHLHWDHMQGLPFFTAGDRNDSNVALYAPAQDGRSGEDLVGLAMSPPSFPITPAGLLGSWTFNAMEVGSHQVGSFDVTAAEVRHKGGRTFGYRVSDGVTDFAYLPDHVAQGAITPGLEAVVRGVDVLLHDAQFLEHERDLANAYGHSTVDDAVDLAARLDVGRLVLFHHGPNRTDDQLDDILAELDPPLETLMAHEGQAIVLE